jgi:uncharacterized protein YceH (UPF0502 family)
VSCSFQQLAGAGAGAVIVHIGLGREAGQCPSILTVMLLFAGKQAIAAAATPSDRQTPKAQIHET